MAARINEDCIRSVIDTDADDILGPIIEYANILTNRVSTCAIAKGVSLGADELRAIETYIAAHLYAIKDGPYSEERTERAEVKYQGQFGKRLESTYWGQTALTLDTSGCLESFSKGVRARVDWLGKPPSEQIDYVDRD